MQVLGSLKDELQVTMVGVYRDQEECTAAAPTNSRHGVQFECLQHKHFQPEVCGLIYESLSPRSASEHQALVHGQASRGCLEVVQVQVTTPQHLWCMACSAAFLCIPAAQ